ACITEGGGREFGRGNFLYQAENGMRYWSVTGVQTCALPISALGPRGIERVAHGLERAVVDQRADQRAGRQRAADGQPLVGLSEEIGRASCRERGKRSGAVGLL